MNDKTSHPAAVAEPFSTRRTAAEEDLRLQQAQTLLRMASRLSRMGAWSVQLPGLEVTFSNEVCAIHEMPTGFVPSVEEAIRFYAPEFRETMTLAFGACVRDGTPFDLELQLITPGGRRVWVRSIGEAVWSSDGTISQVQGAFQDISDRKAAEAEARELAERLTITLESLTDGFFTLDRDWRFTYVNREAERMFTLPRAELLGHDIWSKFPEARDTISHREYARAMRDNVAVQFDTFYPPLGTWFDARAFPSAQGLAVYFRDITAVRQAGEALRSSEERFRLLGKATNDAIWDWDLVTDALWWNEGFEALFGYRREDVDPTAKSWTNCIHPEDLARVKAGIEHVIQFGGESWTDEYRFRCQDGSYAYVLDRGHIIRDGQGNAVRMIGGMTDLTGRKEAENALRESNEKFQLLADHITDAFWIRSADMRELHYVSPAFTRIWGRPAEDLYADPQRWAEFTLAEDRDRVVSAFAGLRGDTRSLDIEYRIVRPDGEIRWIRARGFQVRDAADKLIRLTGIVTDITERQRAAESLRTSHEVISRTNLALQAEIVERKRAEEAADTANRSKSEFLANMSHEIRTPLNGVVGMTELALGTDLTAEQREYLTLIKISGDSLLTVINDILDFSKIEAGKLTVDVIPFDLRDCLATTLKLLVTRAQLKGLSLTCAIPPQVPSGLVGDPSRLRQIVTNLIGNAIKFTEQGGVAVNVDVQTQTDHAVVLRFSVSDTGIGVPQAQQARIFEPFIQADGSTTRKYGGTGLGLTISTKLVALLGGRIWLESESGKGSTFHFTMRCERQPATEFGTRAGDPPRTVVERSLRQRRRALRILLAEDNVVNQLVASRLLGKHGHTVVVAGTGREALAVLTDPASGTFDLILMDLQMPGMDGLEATAIIRAREPSSGSHIPIIAMTAHAMKGDEERCLAAGMDGYVSKPFQIEDVLATIDRVLMPA